MNYTDIVEDWYDNYLWHSKPYYDPYTYQQQIERNNLATTRKAPAKKRKTPPKKKEEYMIYDEGCGETRDQGFSTEATATKAALALLDHDYDCCDGPLALYKRIGTFKSLGVELVKD